MPMKAVTSLSVAALAVAAGLGAWHQLGRFGTTEKVFAFLA